MDEYVRMLIEAKEIQKTLIPRDFSNVYVKSENLMGRLLYVTARTEYQVENDIYRVLAYNEQTNKYYDDFIHKRDFVIILEREEIINLVSSQFKNQYQLFNRFYMFFSDSIEHSTNYIRVTWFKFLMLYKYNKKWVDNKWVDATELDKKLKVSKYIKVSIKDDKALKEISPSNLSTYLEQNNWKKSDTISVYGNLVSSVWYFERQLNISNDVNKIEYVKMVIPENQDFTDYSDRIYEIITVLEEIEQRSQLDIFNELIGN